MDFFIENAPVFTTLRVVMAQGESIRAEPGAMISMSSTIEVKATSSGRGVLGSLKAAMGGENVFSSLFSATGGPGELILTPPAPGDILRIDLENSTVYAQAGAYLAGHTDLQLSTKGSLKLMFSGEEVFLTLVSGTGPLFLSTYGAISEKRLKADETYIVDTGHIIAFEESVEYTIKKIAKTFFSTVASGEGLVCEYRGPGRIWIQSRNLQGFAKLLTTLAPKGT
ncbi:MAG TPA: TIGR00266 family protein [Spirochaetia bacterium]|nr:TIGR00266 family protein [Spirochaetia bacterium]